MTTSEVHINLDEATIACTAEEIAAAFEGLLREMRAAAPFLQASDRAALRQIMGHESGELTVSDVFPDFARGSESHSALRRLRTAQFIRPGGRDMWDGGTRIDVKPFARLAWDRLGEAGIFGEEGSRSEPDEEEIDLSLPEVDDPGEAATLRSKKTDAAKWDDDDILDYVKDETQG